MRPPGRKLERKQAFLFRLVDIASSFRDGRRGPRAERLRRSSDPRAESAALLATGFAELSRERIAAAFARLWRNRDADAYALAQDVLAGRHVWLEETASGLATPSPAAVPPARSAKPGPGERAA